MTQTALVSIAILSALLMSACTAKIEGSAVDTPEPEAFGHMVAGPDVEGAWISKCEQSYDNQYYQRKVEFQGQSVSRSDNYYLDSGCTQMSKKDELKGSFRWADTTSYGGYVVDYRFNVENGVTYFLSEEVLLENGSLYLSGFQVGAGSISKYHPLTRVGASADKPSPEPVPMPGIDPTKVTGIRASSWQTAKYAFCNAQGVGYLLDFTAQDLGAVQEGQVVYEYKVCNSASKFKSAGSGKFSLKKDGTFKMTLDDGYIQDNGKGLKDAWAVIGGNSGMCTFLENKGTKDVFGANYYSWQCE